MDKRMNTEIAVAALGLAKVVVVLVTVIIASKRKRR
jgi:hypothetical protein